MKTRKEKGLTQKQLGELCGINEVQIRRYELGGKNAKPKLETIQKIAKALNVNYSYLLDTKSYKITRELLTDCPNFVDSLFDALGEVVKNLILREHLEQLGTDAFVDALNKIIDTVVLDDNYNVIAVYYKDTEETTMTELFKKLNKRGRIEAIKRIEELTEIKKYTETDK